MARNTVRRYLRGGHAAKAQVRPARRCLDEDGRAEAKQLFTGLAEGDAEEGAGTTSGLALAIAPPTSERVTIDLSAGMPGQSHWRYRKGEDSTTFAAPSFDDSAWSQVGIPQLSDGYAEARRVRRARDASARSHSRFRKATKSLF